jgi:DNA-binding NarL/FixJ family response regulator
MANLSSQPNAVVRVMIVEDDVDTLERLATAITRDARMRVVEKAFTARDAISHLHAAEPDVLLLDLGLPDMSGIEVIRQAARTQKRCDVMVLTILGDEQSVLTSIEAGATGYLLKDSTNNDVVEGIMELRGGGAPMSPGIARTVLRRLQEDARQTYGNLNDMVDTSLTGREIEVLNLIARGYKYTEIGERLCISLHTVTSHIKNTYRKLTVHSGAAAVRRGIELGLLKADAKK